MSALLIALLSDGDGHTFETQVTGYTILRAAFELTPCGLLVERAA